MRLSNRLRDVKFGLGGFKYQTNIRYLKSAERIRADFRTFVEEFNRGPYQYKRLLEFYACIDSTQYLPPQTAGYADLTRLLRMTIQNRRAVYQLWLRLVRLPGSPERSTYIVLAFLQTLRHTSTARPLWFYFKFWLFNWSNSITKYGQLSDADFDIESVDEGFSVEQLVPDTYEQSHEEQIPENKVRAQRKVTIRALREFARAQV